MGMTISVCRDFAPPVIAFRLGAHSEVTGHHKSTGVDFHFRMVNQ